MSWALWDLRRYHMYVIACILLLTMLLLASPLLSASEEKKVQGAGICTLPPEKSYLEEALNILDAQSIALSHHNFLNDSSPEQEYLGHGLQVLHDSIAHRERFTREQGFGVRRVIAAYHFYRREVTAVFQGGASPGSGSIWRTLIPTLTCDMTERQCGTFLCHPGALSHGAAVLLGIGGRSEEWAKCYALRFPNIQKQLVYARRNVTLSEVSPSIELVNVLRLDCSGWEFTFIRQWLRNMSQITTMVYQVHLHFHTDLSVTLQVAHLLFLELYALGFAPVSYERDHDDATNTRYEYTFVNITWFVDTMGLI